MVKAVVLYSGGLDSRLVTAILKEQNVDITAVYFHLPFGCNCSKIEKEKDFLKRYNIKLKVFDCSKEPLLTEYIDTLKNARYGRGASYNPCTDCKIFMLRKAKEYVDKKKVKIIATGEVLGQRPMSQTKKRKEVIDNEIKFEVLRPLSAKLLEATKAEKEGLVNRDKFYGISGRQRKKQMELAREFKIEYPTPSGGCLLCEKAYKKRFKTLIEKGMIDEKNIDLVSIGRHFLMDGEWFVVARNENECVIIDKYKTSVMGGVGLPSVFFNSNKRGNAEELQKAFSKGSKKKERYDKYKL